jgi:hypothetical protein
MQRKQVLANRRKSENNNNTAPALRPEIAARVDVYMETTTPDGKKQCHKSDTPGIIRNTGRRAPLR